MGFLFGDLTRAPFSTNVLEDLRDVIDFAAAIAEADQTIVTADATRDALRKRADEESARLEALARSLLGAAEAADKGAADSVTTKLAADLAGVITTSHKVADAAIMNKLTEDVRAVDAATVAARDDYFAALQEFVLAHVLPGTTQRLRVELVAPKKDERRYVAELVGQTEYGLDWSIEMAVPEEGAWKAPLRVDRVVEGLAVLAPLVTGLIKKEVKPKKQKLDKHFITNVVLDDATLSIELRSEIGSSEGFDFSSTLDGDDLVVVKTGEEGDVTLGPFEVAAEDKEPLLALASKVRAIASELPKKRLVAASFDGLPFDGTNAEAQPKLIELVSRLVARLAPWVDEIAARSPQEDELVLRRQLADDRREEIYMPKARLRENLAPLDEAHRALFRLVASALDATPPAKVLTIEISEPPPPPPPPPSIRSEVPPLVRRRSSGNMRAVVVPPAAPVPAEAPVELAPVEPEPAPASNTAEPTPPSAGTTELVATLKHIRGIAKDGLIDEAFRQYATLFASSTFSACRAEDQRQALKLMILGKEPPPATDEMRAAYRSALPVLQALIVKHRDPADFELLGMTYVALDEPEKGSEIFKKALDIERARNPASDLCGNLMRRVSQL
jgi:hypothetical protein